MWKLKDHYRDVHTGALVRDRQMESVYCESGRLSWCIHVEVKNDFRALLNKVNVRRPYRCVCARPLDGVSEFGERASVHMYPFLTEPLRSLKCNSQMLHRQHRGAELAAGGKMR